MPDGRGPSRTSSASLPKWGHGGEARLHARTHAARFMRLHVFGQTPTVRENGIAQHTHVFPLLRFTTPSVTEHVSLQVPGVFKRQSALRTRVSGWHMRQSHMRFQSLRRRKRAAALHTSGRRPTLHIIRAAPRAPHHQGERTYSFQY